MKSKLFYLLAIIIVGFSLWTIGANRVNDQSDKAPHRDTSWLLVGNQKINIELATTEEEQNHGLSGRNSLGENQGMLFAFAQPGFYGFWMKEMKFPLDIIWLDSQYKIIDITKNIPPETYPASITSKVPAQYVLEVQAGFCDTNEIKIGDTVKKASN